MLDRERIGRAFEIPARAFMEVRARRDARHLAQLSQTTRSTLVAPGGPVVSLTSYGTRLNTVHLTLESIAQGYLLPSRIILWMDQEEIFNNPPDPIVSLIQRGLEVTLTTNFGPHTKYYPFIESQSDFQTPLVTADDDILYPRYWLQHIFEAYRERPDLINCYRARVIEMQAGRLATYDKWQMCNSRESTIRHFATGVSGVIYPPAFLSHLKVAGRSFENCCPKADDIWLHVQALRNGFQVRQFVKRFRHFPMIPGTQDMALQKSNRGEHNPGNDRQAALTYNQGDLDLLQSLV